MSNILQNGNATYNCAKWTHMCLQHPGAVASIEIQVEWFLIFLHHQFHGNFLVSLEKLNIFLESFEKLSGS